MLELTDDDILANKLNIQMSADEIINSCKSYGLNGIQNNCLLRIGRVKQQIQMNGNKFVYENETELIEDNHQPDSGKTKKNNNKRSR